MRRNYYRGYGPDARARYFRRAGIGVGALTILAVIGIIAAALRLSTAFGVGAAPVAIPLAILFWVFLIFRLLLLMRGFGNPLRQVMDAADRVAEGDYSMRVNESGPPPIRALIRSFNTMTTRLHDADRVRRDLMADVAHELRTPLAVLQGRIEGLIDGVYPHDEAQLQQLLDETQVLSRLVEDLRTLALSDAGALPLQKEPTNLVDLVRDVARSFSGQHAGIVTPDHRDVIVDVDPVRVREVTSNLIANAIRYTPASGRISITIDEQVDRVALTISDTGRGIAAEQLPRLFDRFFKDPESRGSGLGLAIAKGIVTAHGGDISVSSTPGEGTAIRVTLPR